MNSTSIKELKEIIESEDTKIWSVHKHSCADRLVKLEPTAETKEYLWEIFKKTGDYYFASVSKKML